jgi:MFS family permease
VAVRAEERVRLVRRSTLLLVGAQVALWSSAGAFATFGPISVFVLTGRERMAAVLIGVFYLALAVGARIAGRYMDRAGRRRVPLTLATGTTTIPAAGHLLIGVGWSAAYVRSTAVVSDLARPAERAEALGLTDLVAAVSAATGVLTGAVVLEGAGLPVLVPAALVLLAAAAAALTALRSGPPAVRATSEG